MAPDDTGPDSFLANAAAAANSFTPLAIQSGATGLRTSELRHRALPRPSDPRAAEDFLVNTRLTRTDREQQISIESYFSDHAITMLSALDRQTVAASETVELPPSVELSMALGEVVGQRRSVRTYTGDPIGLDHLATLVRCAGGATAEATVPMSHGGEGHYRFRSYPSAGGLYPVELHLVPLAVRGLPREVYRYDALGDRLVRSADEQAARGVLAAVSVPDEMISVSRANVLFLFLARPGRVMRKYGARGMRFVFMEAGYMGQTLNLAATALGLGSVDCASIYDDEVHAALKLDGCYEALVHTTVVGYPG